MSFSSERVEQGSLCYGPLCTTITDPIELRDRVHCAVRWTSGDLIPHCVVQGDDWSFPDGADACFLVATDDRATSAPTWDDVSATCSSTGAQIEIVLEQAADLPVHDGIEATCFADLLFDELCP